MSIEQAYNNWASQYDSNKNRTRDLDAKATIETLKNYNFGTVIELGCGTGKNTSWLVQRASRIIALDFSKEMLRKAKEKIVDKRVTFKKADLTEDWNISDHYADLITCSLTLEHIQDLNLIFSQAFQKLKKDGIFFISELHPYKHYSGSAARFETEKGTQELEVYTHHISEYLRVAKDQKLKLIELNEWFDEDNKAGPPRLINFVFRR